MPSAVVTPARGSQEQLELNYKLVMVIGNGSFGVVHLARLSGGDEFVAIKKVHQDRRYKHRELSIMRTLQHKNIVDIKYFFYSVGIEEAELYLNLILEYVPETVHHVERHYSRLRQPIPLIYIKLYAFQLLRALSYIHGRGVCHRDIKPQNLLVDPSTSVLKLCDFGSAKCVMNGESNLSYICSRYYRAPELLFGSVSYTFSVDVWSAGAVLAELFLGRPLFSGMSALDQLIEVIKVLGTPSKQQVRDMNPHYQQRSLPNVAMVPWSSVLPPGTCPEALDLVSKLLTYSPSSRLNPLQGCAHILFDELRRSNCNLPNGRTIPCCTDFTALEIAPLPHLAPILSPQSAPPEMNSPVMASGGSVSLLSECIVDGLGTDVASAGDSLTTHQVV